MANPFKKSSRELESSTGAILVTKEAYFGKNGETPYAQPSKFLEFGEGLRTKEVADWGKCLECMVLNMKMDGNPTSGIDAGLRPYKYHRAFKAKAVLGFKIIDGGGMPELIKDYQDGKITINFTLDQLIEEAQKA